MARLPDKLIAELYDLLSEPMLDFDCGTLCAAQPGAIPPCCDNTEATPVLFVSELRWQRRQGPFWRRLPRRTRLWRELAPLLDLRKDTLCRCPGPARCRRERRALVCRTFPFEPHLDPRGNILGLTYNYTGESFCPLIGRTDVTYRPTYIRNAIRYWEIILSRFPEDRDLYTDESRKLRRQFRRQGKPVPLFRG